MPPDGMDGREVTAEDSHSYGLAAAPSPAGQESLDACLALVALAALAPFLCLLSLA
jgi:hypothetical protein